MKQADWKTIWLRFLRWNGWTAWLKWKGWPKALYPHPLLVTALSVLSAAGLVWIFLTGREESWIAYPLYCAAFYALVTVTALIPKAVQKGKQTLHKNPRAEQALQDSQLHFTLGLYVEQFVNFLYGVGKTVSGIVVGSAWIGADGLYNLAQAIIQLVQILRRRKNLTMEQQWKSYRLCGWLTLGMHLTITGLVYQMTRMDRFEDYPGFMIFATAAFVFYKLIDTIVDVARDRKHKAPIDSAVRYLDLSQALYNLFSLQVAMLHAFGEPGADHTVVNSMTGAVVCLLIVGMGVYMIRRANRVLKPKKPSVS